LGHYGRDVAQLSFFFLRRSFIAVRTGFPESDGSGPANPNPSNPGSGVTLANEVETVEYSGSWLFASLATRTFFPPSPPRLAGIGPWEVVSSYSSATAPDSHRISRAAPLS